METETPPRETGLTLAAEDTCFRRGPGVSPPLTAAVLELSASASGEMILTGIVIDATDSAAGAGAGAVAAAVTWMRIE